MSSFHLLMLMVSVDLQTEGVMWNNLKASVNSQLQDAPKLWHKYIEMFLFKHLMCDSDFRTPFPEARLCGRWMQEQNHAKFKIIEKTSGLLKILPAIVKRALIYKTAGNRKLNS